MTTVGRWSPNKVRKRLLEDSWAFPNSGMVLMRPSSIAFSGVTASITVNGSVSFSAVESLSLNGVFTSAYDNYIMAVRYVGSVNGEAFAYRLRVAGTDNTTSNSYVSQQLYATGTTISPIRYTLTLGYFGFADDTQRGGATAYLFGPNLAQPTAVRGVTVDGFSDAVVIDYASTHNQSTAYDGITIYPGTGNVTGLVSVYGLGG